MKNEHRELQADNSEKLARDVAALASEAGELLLDLGNQKLKGAREGLTEARSAVAGRAHELSAVGNEYVHSHPWRAVGIAAFAGLLAGLVLARR